MMTKFIFEWSVSFIFTFSQAAFGRNVYKWVKFAVDTVTVLMYCGHSSTDIKLLYVQCVHRIPVEVDVLFSIYVFVFVWIAVYLDENLMSSYCLKFFEVMAHNICWTVMFPNIDWFELCWSVIHGGLKAVVLKPGVCVMVPRGGV